MGKFFEILVKRLYGRFDGKLFPLVSVPCSYIALLHLLLKKKKNQIIILPTNAIGDTLYILSFWQQLHNISIQGNLQFYISDRYKKIVETYSPKIKGVVYLKHLGFKHLFLLTLSAGLYNPSSINIARKCRIFSVIPRVHKAWLKGRGLKGTRNQLSHILNIPLVPIACHGLSRSPVQAIENFQSIKSKICIINPYSYSMKFSEGLYEKIVQKLSNLGYVVFTNVVDNQKAIEGSEPLRASLDELFSIACEIPLVVSVRSGILDFLIPSKVNMFVVYEKWKDIDNEQLDIEGDENPYSLMEWNPRGLIYESFLKEGEENKVFDEFCSYLDDLTIRK